MKKIHKIWLRESYKTADKAKKEEEDAEKREKNLEDAKKIKIHEDPKLPKAKLIKIHQGTENREIRVKIFGWVHRLRRQGTKTFCFNVISNFMNKIHLQKKISFS